MATTVGNERDTSTILSLPVGFYYYLIPRLHINTATYLGYVDTIQSLTFNPFIDEADIGLLVNCPFNTDKYGRPDTGTPSCFRIESFDNIEKEIGIIELFETKQKNQANTVPYDPKLEMYPYTYYLVTDYINPPLLIKPQFVNARDNRLRVKVTTTPLSAECKYNLYVDNYKGDDEGNLEGMTNTTPLMLPVTSSIYSQFISTSMASFTQGNINALLENDKTLNQGLASNGLQYNINRAQNNLSLMNGGWNIIGNLLSGNFGGALQGAFSNGANYGLNNQINNMQSQLTQKQLNENAKLTEYEINTMAQAKVTDMLNTPNAIKTAGNDTIFNLINSNQKIDIIKYEPKAKVKRKISMYFERYGYRYNEYGKLGNHINSRKYYNFVKTSSCNIATAKVPLIHLEEIKEIFNRGTTIWHIDRGAEPLNYDVKNMEV